MQSTAAFPASRRVACETPRETNQVVDTQGGGLFFAVMQVATDSRSILETQDGQCSSVQVSVAFGHLPPAPHSQSWRLSLRVVVKQKPYMHSHAAAPPAMVIIIIIVIESG